MFDTLASQIGAVLVVFVCGFAFLKGDEPERVGAGIYILAWFATMIAQQNSQLYAVFALDLVMVVVFGAMTWKARRTWPVWACACQLLIVMSHVVWLVDIRPPANSFITVINLAGYGVLVALAVGTFWSWQERRAAGLE